MVWYGMVNVDLYSAIIAKVSNALNTLVSSEKPGFQALSKKTHSPAVRGGRPARSSRPWGRAQRMPSKMHTDLITVRGGMTFSVCPSVGACVRACLGGCICLPACCQPPVLRCGVSVNFYKASVLSAQFYKCLLLHS